MSLNSSLKENQRLERDQRYRDREEKRLQNIIRPKSKRGRGKHSVNLNISSNSSIMSDPDASSHATGSKKVLEKFSDADRKEIEQYVQQCITASQGTIRVTNVNTCIEVPKFDSRRMTSSTYLGKLKTYFKAQGYERSQYHIFVATALKGEFKLWYDAHSQRIKSWDDFCDLFKARFDSKVADRQRIKYLHTRKQGMNDPCEQFIYEMVALSHQIDRNEDMEQTLL